MSRKIIDIGTIGNDGTGDSIRDSFRKVNDNFRELYGAAGLGERLTLVDLTDTPDSYESFENAVLAIGQDNTAPEGLAVKFKALVEGNGITIDHDSDQSQIRISADFASIVSDENPQLGGDLNAERPGGLGSWTIYNLDTPREDDQVANKGYVDTKISKAGVNAIDPETNRVNPSFGTMSGPLILSRDPEPDDDETYGGLIAATKRYVDNAAFGSKVNLYVATSGQDYRAGVSDEIQGRALAYAYRTIEAACKRAEELMLLSQNDIGPYRKVLTYNNGVDICTLEEIGESPNSGSNFAGYATMSVDTVELTPTGVGTFYSVGDIIEIPVPAGSRSTEVTPAPARFEVLSVGPTSPGSVITFRQISSGVYTDILPGTSEVATTTDSITGFGAKFNVTYKVNNVVVTNGGTGYSLVSVRIESNTGDPAPTTPSFGTAVVNVNKIDKIIVTDSGSGFTTIPVVRASLPRFFIETGGQRTDFTGDVTTDTPVAFRGRDIREGLYLQGVESGAIGQILQHNGDLDSRGYEIFDIDVQSGAFQEGEAIAYGDVTKIDQISILVESGVYEENYPLKLPQNCAIIGDEFRRVLVRPKAGTSSSPWSFQYFRRDTEIDGLSIVDKEGNSTEYGYHYLHDKTLPVYSPLVSNPGRFTAAANLIYLNKTFISEEVVAWINDQIDNNIAPFVSSFEYNTTLCKRDVALILDAVIFDIRYGGYNRTISSALKYYENASGRLAISPSGPTGQLQETVAALNYTYDLVEKVIDNVQIAPLYQNDWAQIIDGAFIKESGAETVIRDLMDAIIDVIDGSGSVNYPLENEEIDVFLCNDATIIRALTCQGHGGFMCVLDPEGQILAKSPYIQESASFSRSKDRQVLAGGMFVDGFSGNLEFKIKTVVSTTRLEVEGLARLPNLPCSFIVNDTVYRVNYIRDYAYNVNGSTATFILDETTPWPFPVFTYNSSICSRDVGLIIDGLGYDIVLGTNYNTRKAGLSYRQANASVVIEDQNSITRRAISLAHEYALDAVSTVGDPVVENSEYYINLVIERGAIYAPSLTFTEPTGLPAAISNAKDAILDNFQYFQDEIIGYVNSVYGITYSTTKCARDVRYILEALLYDLLYGGNSQTVDAGLKYYDGVGTAVVQQIPAGQKAETAGAINHLNYLVRQVVNNLAPAVPYSTTPRVAATPTDVTTTNLIQTLLNEVEDIVTNGVGAAATKVYPDLNAYTYNSFAKADRTALASAKATIQSEVIAWINENGNKYELLMPGNRSLLCNDFTQVNDLGYGILATNSGLVEAVSMFTYYNHISYYALKGAQIRSIGGSSAHGNYALVAEGADPLEVPTPTSLYYDLAQRVDCYFPSATFANVVEGLQIYVNNYDYEPLGGSELEIDHGHLIYRYPVTSVSTSGLPDGVALLNLTSDDTGNFDGLFAQVPDGTKMSLRSNSKVILTDDLVEVATRPSTGLILQENPDEVYRVLQFETAEDTRGQFEVQFSATSPTVINFLQTITDIDTNVCTTSMNHGLVVGHKFIPQTTSNGLTAGTTYYVIDVPQYNQFELSTAPGGSTATLSNGTGLSIKGIVTHRQNEGYTISFTNNGGSLPGTLIAGEIYYILADGLSDLEFNIGLTAGGNAIGLANSGTGTHLLRMRGLTLTTLRENYNYVDLTTFQPGEYVTGPTVCTISTPGGSPSVITTSTPHGLSVGSVIRFETTGKLPIGLSETKHYFVYNNDYDSLGAGSLQFTVAADWPTLPTGIQVEAVAPQSGTHSFGLVTGRAGDSSFAVVPVAPEERSRVIGSKVVWNGEEYIIIGYDSEDDTGEVYGRITLDRPLETGVNEYSAPYSVKSAVAARTVLSTGRLTIRIALTRVTSHDLLEIGTGSYADTNYPKEIYGLSVNPFNADAEVEERGVGRVFYVTTDQYGNFSVGPYFKVDQGTGAVTFAASIALSNLDGIGFKRGVPIAEFSTDSTFSDNAVDTVPTENATRAYIDRRLGVTHSGDIVDPAALIPTLSGGFLDLGGQQSMKGPINLDDNKITNLDDPVNPQDAVNLRSLKFENLQNFYFNDINAGDIIVFTGENKDAISASVIGDVTFELRTGVDSSLNQVDVQIVADTIINTDVHAPADNTDFTANAIAQSKLKMNKATTAAAAPTGDEQAKQATLGTASFDSVQFTATDGWITVKNNGLTYTKLAKTTAGYSTIGNNTSTAGDLTEVTFANIISGGLGVKKSQFSATSGGAATGFLRRVTPPSGSGPTGDPDSNFRTVEASATWNRATSTGAGLGDNDKLVIRSSSGDIASRHSKQDWVVLNPFDLGVTPDALATSEQVLSASWYDSTDGYNRLYAYGNQGGIFLQTALSPLGTDKNLYSNDFHEFVTLNGNSPAPISCSSVTTGEITAGGITSPGTITGYWSLASGSRLQATYSADLAEYYEGDKQYEVGTVLVFGGEKEVTIANMANDTRVAGVVSDNAAVAMYEACPGIKNLVALQGRVPVRVAGTIKKGDILVTSGIAGVAVVNNNPKPGTIIGKALENYDSDHIGTIEVAVGRN